MKKFLGLVALSLFVTMQTGHSIAAPKSIKSEYRLKFFGFTLASMKFNTKIDGAKYEVSGDIKSASLGNIVDAVKGRTTVKGVIGKENLQARTYTMNYTHGKKKRAFNVNFDKNGKVLKSKVSPKPPKRGKHWVEVNQKDLAAVVDPISGMTFPMGKPVCSRTVTMFDGETLVDFKLSPKGSRRFKTKGFKGRVTVCNVQFIPRGGYRSNQEAVRFLKKQKNMEVWFAKNDNLKVHFPVYAKIPTQIGDVRVWATDLTASF